MRALWLTVFASALGITFAPTGRADDADALSPSREPEPAPEASSLILGPADATYVFEAAGRSGYASTPIRGGVSPFGAGFGARAGVDLWHFYLGAGVMDYLGGSDVGATDHALLAGVELGYNLPVGRYLTIRPLVGVGDTLLSHTEPGAAAPATVDVVTSASGTSSSGSSGGGAVTTTVKNVYFQPGVTALVHYRRFFGALNVGAVVVPGILYGPSPAEETTWVCYSFDVQLGFRL